MTWKCSYPSSTSLCTCLGGSWSTPWAYQQSSYLSWNIGCVAQKFITIISMTLMSLGTLRRSLTNQSDVRLTLYEVWITLGTHAQLRIVDVMYIHMLVFPQVLYTVLQLLSESFNSIIFKPSLYSLHSSVNKRVWYLKQSVKGALKGKSIRSTNSRATARGARIELLSRK